MKARAKSPSRAVLGLLGCTVMLSSLPLAHALKQDMYCSNYTWEYCPPGAYNCTPWLGQQCQGLGISQSKKGIVFEWRNCLEATGSTCNDQSVLCQRDIYYKDLDCQTWCTEHTQRINGCLP